MSDADFTIRAGERIELHPPKLSHVIANRIRERIGSGELPRGSRLPSETAMLTELNVSRPILREAFRILEGEGLIRTGRGTRNPVVLGPSIQKSAQLTSYLLAVDAVTLGDLHQSRLYVEPEVLRHLSGEELGLTARELARCLERYGDPSQVNDAYDSTTLSKRFHEVLIGASANPVVRMICRTIFEISQQSYEALGDAAATAHREEIARYIPVQLAAYQRLAGLLAKGETTAAADKWTGYLEHVAGMLVSSGLGDRPLTVQG